MQNNQKIIAIFGAGGFLGKYLMRELTKLDYRIKVATRNPYLKGYLKPLGNPGQIELFKTNIFNEEDVRKVLQDCDFAINLVGILYETRKQKFNQIHSQFPFLISQLCNELNIKKLVHISALGIKEKHSSKYMQSKLQGEKNILENFSSSIILRPSIIFGPGEKFFNTFATLAQFSPIIPLIGGGKTKFAPIYVGDVVEAITKTLEFNNSKTKVYELGGPENFSFKELMEILLKEIKKQRFLVSIQSLEKLKLSAKKKAETLNLLVTSLSSNLLKEKVTFDVVLNMEVIEHVENPEFFIDICSNLLKNKGLMFCSTINKNLKSYLFAILGAEYVMQWLPKGTHDWNKFIKPNELKKLFFNSGLTIKDTKGFVFNPLSWGWELSKSDFTVNYAVCATR